MQGADDVNLLIGIDRLLRPSFLVGPFAAHRCQSQARDGRGLSAMRMRASMIQADAGRPF
jgi:hypothetical protein